MEDKKKVRSSTGKTLELPASHADRLLAYPKSDWKELEGEQAQVQALPEAVEGAGEQVAPATKSTKTKAS